MSTVKLLSSIFFGIIASVANELTMKYSVSKFIESGSGRIIISGFLLRMFSLAMVFYLTTSSNPLGSIPFIAGVLLWRLWFTLRVRFSKQLEM
ncbi:MAG: ATP synthase subunit I [Rickettsiales bacterium]|jgi:hypothetical protein|nr:ATP synthase subunit I [Rickettsiales bacterium]